MSRARSKQLISVGAAWAIFFGAIALGGDGLDPVGETAAGFNTPSPAGGPAFHGPERGPVALGTLSPTFSRNILSYSTSHGSVGLSLFYAHAPKAWWHSLESYVKYTPANGRWTGGQLVEYPEAYELRRPGGQHDIFLPDINGCPDEPDTTCYIAGEGPSRVRLRVLDGGGFVAILVDGTHLIFGLEDSNIAIPPGSTTWLLTRIETPSAAGGIPRPLLRLDYDVLGSESGTTCANRLRLKEAWSPRGSSWEGTKLLFNYASITSGGSSCVLSSIQGVAGSESARTIASFGYSGHDLWTVHLPLKGDTLVFTRTSTTFKVVRNGVDTVTDMTVVPVMHDNKLVRSYVTHVSGNDTSEYVGWDGGSPGIVNEMQLQWFVTNAADPEKSISAGTGNDAGAVLKTTYEVVKGGTASRTRECLSCTPHQRSDTWSWAAESFSGWRYTSAHKRPSGAYDVRVPVPGVPGAFDVKLGTANAGGSSPQIEFRQQFELGDTDAGTPRLLKAVATTSVLDSNPGLPRRTEYEYENEDNGGYFPRLVATSTSGFTVGSTGTTELTHVKTFERQSRQYSTGSTFEGKVVETHGPCRVSSADASVCDPSEPFPVTALHYAASAGSGYSYEVGRPVRSDRGYVAGGVFTVVTSSSMSSYDSLGRPTETSSDPASTHTFEYHPTVQEKVWRETAKQVIDGGTPASHVTTYTYDSSGRLQYIALPDGQYEHFSYLDSASPVGLRLRWRAISPDANPINWVVRTEFFYGSQGRVTREVRSRRVDQTTHVDLVKRWDFNPFGDRTIEAFGEGTGTFSSRWVPDVEGRTEVFAAAYAPTLAGSAHLMSYDRLNRLTSVSSPLDGETDYVSTLVQKVDGSSGYDAHGNIAALKLQCGGVGCVTKNFAYQHDDFGRLVSAITPAMAGAATFRYDARGNLTRRSSPAMSGAYVENTYDGIGRLLKTSAWSGGVETQLNAFEYDTSIAGCAAENASGRLATVHDSFGVTSYSYDWYGRTTRIRRARTGSPCSDTRSDNNPNSEFVYDSLGRLAAQTYPHGRVVKYQFGDGTSSTALKSQIVGISIVYEGVERQIIQNARYRADGSILSYELVDDLAPGLTNTALVSFEPGASESALGNCGGSPGTPDRTGRLRKLSVARGSSFDIPVFEKHYRWTADQLDEERTCIRGQNAGTLQYKVPAVGLRPAKPGYDELLRLRNVTRAGGETIRANGQSIGLRQYSYKDEGNRSTDIHDCWTFTSNYDSTYPDRLLSRAITSNSCSNLYKGTLQGTAFTYDADGRTLTRRMPADPAFATTPNSQLIFDWSGTGSNVATGSVFRTVQRKRGSSAGITDQYYYDSNGRRRLKAYGEGHTDEFFWAGTQLIEDRGHKVNGNNQITAYPIDEYIWLGGMPVVMIKSRFSTSWTRDGDTESVSCDRRNGDAANCGIYFIVNDYLGKPVVMLDRQFRITGVGEYDPFGHVNRVLFPADSPRDANKNHLVNQNVVLAYLKQPAFTGITTEVRPRFNLVDTDASAYAFIANRQDVNKSGNISGTNALAPATWFTLGGPDFPNNDFRVRFVSGPTNSSGRKGINFEGYDYQRREPGAPRVWTPLRLPGQYYDSETDLFENWSRFYDPSVGRYLSPDPILMNPGAVLSAAAGGVSTPAYAYASNNPVSFTDPTGLMTCTEDTETGVFTCVPTACEMAGNCSVVGSAGMDDFTRRSADRPDWQTRDHMWIDDVLGQPEIWITDTHWSEWGEQDAEFQCLAQCVAETGPDATLSALAVSTSAWPKRLLGHRVVNRSQPLTNPLSSVANRLGGARQSNPFLNGMRDFGRGASVISTPVTLALGAQSYASIAACANICSE